MLGRSLPIKKKLRVPLPWDSNALFLIALSCHPLWSGSHVGGGGGTAWGGGGGVVSQMFRKTADPL